MADTTKHDAIDSELCPERNTIGADSAALRAKKDDRIEARELSFEANKTYLSEIEKVARSSKKKGWVNPFYICVFSSKHSTMINVMRRRFFARQTIPAPQPKYAVYKYFPATGNHELLWALPCQEAIDWLMDNQLTLPKDYRPAGKMALDYASGRLHAKMHAEDPTIAKEVFNK